MTTQLTMYNNRSSFPFQGEALNAESPEGADSSGNEELAVPTQLQRLKPVPYYDSLVANSDEEKIRVSVHNYTKALKRHRGMC